MAHFAKMYAKLSVALWTAWGLTACSSSGQKEETPQVVKVHQVGHYDGNQEVVLPGKVKARDEAKLAFRIAGPIKAIKVNTGQFVRRGTLLALLDDRDYQIQLSATEAEYKRIKAEAERVMRLHASESVSDNDFDKASYGLQQITAKLNAHRNALQDTRLVAPYDGYVQEPLFRAGETVGAGMPIMSIVSGQTPEVEIDISGKTYLQRERFASFSCTSDLFPDKAFDLQLVSIDPIANLNQLHTMRLQFSRKQGEQIPAIGSSVMVSISYKQEEAKQELIPLSALFERAGKSYVWLIEDKAPLRLRLQEVAVVAIHKDGMAICTGLQKGQSIVAAGVAHLKEGDAVRPTPTVSNTNAGGLL